MKYCNKCKRNKEESEFYKLSRTKDGLLHWCKACEVKRQRHYRLLDRGYWKEKNKRYYYKHKEEIKNKRKVAYQLNKHKALARGKVKTALLNGTLIRPQVCDKCGVRDKIQAHHEDYNKPLDVIWLCKPCHGVRDYELLCKSM